MYIQINVLTNEAVVRDGVFGPIIRNCTDTDLYYVEQWVNYVVVDYVTKIPWPIDTSHWRQETLDKRIEAFLFKYKVRSQNGYSKHAYIERR